MRTCIISFPILDTEHPLPIRRYYLSSCKIYRPRLPSRMIPGVSLYPPSPPSLGRSLSTSTLAYIRTQLRPSSMTFGTLLTWCSNLTTFQCYARSSATVCTILGFFTSYDNGIWGTKRCFDKWWRRKIPACAHRRLSWRFSLTFFSAAGSTPSP